MVTAACILEDLIAAGIVPAVVDGNLVFPGGTLSDDLRYHIRIHKAELVEILTCDWRTLAARYYTHHFGCEHCIAAGRNETLSRCPIGKPLWDAYIGQHNLARRLANHGPQSAVTPCSPNHQPS